MNPIRTSFGDFEYNDGEFILVQRGESLRLDSPPTPKGATILSRVLSDLKSQRVVRATQPLSGDKG